MKYVTNEKLNKKIISYEEKYEKYNTINKQKNE